MHSRVTNPSAALADSVAAHFPQLAIEGDEALAEFLAAGRLVELRPGDPVFRAGDPYRAWLLVLDGRVPVRLISESGREITLYEVESGRRLRADDGLSAR